MEFFISNPMLCSIMGLLLHYFWLTTFLIMSFISLECFYRFSNICQPWFVKHGNNKKKVKVCWIVSAKIMSIPICLDQFTDLPLEYASSSGICFIEPHIYIISLFVGPTLFLLCINVICFVGTLYNIYQAVSDNEILAANDRNMAKICAKISALMGVTWLLAIVPFVTGIYEIWYVFIILNGSQGVYIFFSSGMPGHIMKVFRAKTTGEQPGNEQTRSSTNM